MHLTELLGFGKDVAVFEDAFFVYRQKVVNYKIPKKQALKEFWGLLKQGLVRLRFDGKFELTEKGREAVWALKQAKT